MNSKIVWFDIPVQHLDRACQFYHQVLAIELERQVFPEAEIAVFPGEPGHGPVGCLAPTQDPVVSGNAPLLYFSVEGRLQQAVAGVTTHGGQVLQPIKAIGQWGFRALILDSEGNRLALHASTTD